MDNKPLSQRKSFANDKSSKVFEISPKNFHESKTNQNIISNGTKQRFNNFYDTSTNQNKKAADLVVKEDNNAVKLSTCLTSQEKLNRTQAAPSTAPPPLPKNFKRIPAMIQSLTQQEDFIRKAKHVAERGRTESNHRITSMSGLNESQALRGSSERPANIRDYKLGRLIGKGAYAVVKLATEKPSKELLAMKIYEKFKLTDPARRKSVIREIAIMKRMKHDNIVQMYKSFDNPHSIHIVMEFVRGKSLYQYLKERPGKRLYEDEAKIIMKQLVEAMKYIHSQNVTHRDLKLENIIINTNTKKIKIIDFGFSITSGHEKKLKIF